VLQRRELRPNRLPVHLFARPDGSGDLAVEPERPRFIASLLVLPKPIQSPLGELSRDVSAPSNQIRFG